MLFDVQVTRPYITFIFSLVISDAFASFLLGFQLLTGSYLPLVAGIAVNNCLLLGAEGLKLVGIIVTVFHLLVMVTLHLGGVINPVKFKEVVTSTLWTLISSPESNNAVSSHTAALDHSCGSLLGRRALAHSLPGPAYSLRPGA